jgi:hypothetical protein
VVSSLGQCSGANWTGSQDHRHLSVRRRLPPMAKAKQNMCLHRQWLCEEIIRNIFFPNCNHSCFIHIVSFELELTSYVQNVLVKGCRVNPEEVQMHPVML